MISFDDFFRAATGHTAYDYQCRLACGEKHPGLSDTQWLTSTTACQSQLIDIPTAVSKTAGINFHQ